ncbi:hypothetical protein FXO38_15399, partial [Capsicum annuum]
VQSFRFLRFNSFNCSVKGIQLLYTEEPKSTPCWIGITLNLRRGAGSGRGRSRQDIRSISMSATWKWIDETRNATEPHFHEVHKILFRFKEKLIKLRSAESNSQRRRHP